MFKILYGLFVPSADADVQIDLAAPTRASLINYVEKRREKVHEIARWYKRHVLWRKFLTFAVRVAVLLAIGNGGIILLRPPSDPATFLWWTFSSQGNAALAAGMVAGLLVASNQIFMLSASWSRYSLAEMDIEAKEQSFSGEWEKLRATLTDGNAVSQLAAVVDLISHHIADVYSIMRTETAGWGADLAAAMGRLEQMAKDQRSTAETLAKEQQRVSEAARVTSAIRVAIADFQNMAGPVSVSIGRQTAESPSPTASLAVTDVPVGAHAVVLKYRDKGDVERVLYDAVRVDPGKIATVSFSVPPA